MVLRSQTVTLNTVCFHDEVFRGKVWVRIIFEIRAVNVDLGTLRGEVIKLTYNFKLL